MVFLPCKRGEVNRKWSNRKVELPEDIIIHLYIFGSSASLSLVPERVIMGVGKDSLLTECVSLNIWYLFFHPFSGICKQSVNSDVIHLTQQLSVLAPRDLSRSKGGS
jgi:hypothetical protein